VDAHHYCHMYPHALENVQDFPGLKIVYTTVVSNNVVAILARKYAMNLL